MRAIQGFDELRRWVINTDEANGRGQTPVYNLAEVNKVASLSDMVAKSIADDYPFYSKNLPSIVRRLFPRLGNGFFSLNIALFGELYLIVQQLHEEPANTFLWSMIHPRISGIAKEEYLNGFYESAARKSMIEVETRLRELYKELRPGMTVPSQVGDLIGALLADNGDYHFCDTSDRSGRDYRKGVQHLFMGAFSAYRNPSAHANLELKREEAFARIVLASQLISVLSPLE